MKIIAAPGQGAQTPGFLNPWLELDGVRDTLSAYSDIVAIDLIAAGTTADAETIRDTAVAQPLIVAAGLIAHAALLTTDLAPQAEVGYAGHSVGEITAAALAGVLSAEDAMRFVSTRSRGMAEAAHETSTGMSAVLTRGDIGDAAAAIIAAGLHVANYNGSGQIVAAGSTEAIAAFAAEPPAGVKVIPLSVAGAFHTPFMASAIPPLRALANTLKASSPIHPIYTNWDGSRVDDGTQYLDHLVEQVARPVRWDLCQESFIADGVTALVELAPAGTLTGLARRGLPGTSTVALKTPDDLDAARALLAERDPETSPIRNDHSTAGDK